MDRDSFFSKVGAFLGGVAIGSLVGVLFAPSSGKETRDKLKENFGDLENKAKEKMDEIKEMTLKQVEKIKTAANDAIEKGKEAIEKGKEKFEKDKKKESKK